MICQVVFQTCHNFPQLLHGSLRQLDLFGLVKVVHELLGLCPIVPVGKEEEALQVVGQ